MTGTQFYVYNNSICTSYWSRLFKPFPVIIPLYGKRTVSFYQEKQQADQHRYG
jgi:hypothetical protein